MIASYESPPPDIATVMLQAHGFADLIERVDDLQAISRENASATTHVAQEQTLVTAQTKRLAALEASHARETSAVLVQRDEVAQLHLALVNRQLQYIRARDRKSSELGALQSHKRSLESELNRLAANELAAEGVAGAYTGPIGEFTPTPQGSYGFFPAAGTNYSVGEEPTLAEHLNTLGNALHLHLIGISGYRSPAALGRGGRLRQRSAHARRSLGHPRRRGRAPGDARALRPHPPVPGRGRGRSHSADRQPLLTPAAPRSASRREARGRAVGREHLRQLHGAVGLLAVLEQRDDRAPDGHGGAVERVRRLGAALGARTRMFRRRAW